MIFSDKIYYRQTDGGESNKVIKGKNLKSVNENDRKTGTHSYEFHINISDKIFRVCSLDFSNC